MSSATARAMSSDRSSASRCVLGRCADPVPASRSTAHRRSAPAPRRGAAAPAAAARGHETGRQGFLDCRVAQGRPQARSPGGRQGSAGIPYLPSQYYPAAAAPTAAAAAARAARRVRLLAAVDPEAERATGRKGMVMRRVPQLPMRSTRPDASSRSSAFRARLGQAGQPGRVGHANGSIHVMNERAQEADLRSGAEDTAQRGSARRSVVWRLDACCNFRQ